MAPFFVLLEVLKKIFGYEPHPGFHANMQAKVAVYRKEWEAKSVQALGADQFDEGSEEERKAKSSFFTWWFFGVCGAASAAALAIVNIQDHAGWTVGFGIATIGISLSLFVFLLGRNSYRQLPLGGSPMTQIAQVFVATVRKWRVKPAAAQLESLIHVGTEAHLGTRYLAKTNHFQ